MRISDWSSDVCSSDLLAAEREAFTRFEYTVFRAEFIDRYAKENQPSSWKQTESSLKELDVDFAGKRIDRIERDAIDRAIDRLKKRNKSEPLDAHKAITKLYKWANDGRIFDHHTTDRKSVEKGKSVSVRVDLGGRSIIKNKQKQNKTMRIGI